MAKKTKLTASVLAFVFIMLNGCANQMPPGGGEIDKTPPEIIDSFPQNGITDFKEKRIELTFSEYVDHRSVQEALFISPAVEGEKDFDWSGKTLEINFENPLKDSTTYTVTLGTDVTDLNNRNKMASPFSLVFSTGDKIDKGSISGTIRQNNPEGISVFAYKQHDTEINPAEMKPDYVSQVGKNGVYAFKGLSGGTFRIFAVRDKIRDQKYSKADDEYGAPFTEIKLSDDSASFSNLDFFMTVEDTSRPIIKSAAMKDIHHILIEFSKPVDSSKVKAGCFSIVDSTAGEKYPVKYFFKGDARDRQFYIAFKDSLKEDNELYLSADSISDKIGNEIENIPVRISISDKPDTVAAKLLSLEGTLPDGGLDYENSAAYLRFSDAFDTTAAANGIEILDLKNNVIPVSISFTDDATAKLVFPEKLKPRTEYQARIRLFEFADIAGNKTDSVFTKKFTTVSELDFSGASGKVSGFSAADKVKVRLSGVPPMKTEYQQKILGADKFDFRKIMPGKYLLWGYIDSDGNGKYSNGSVVPFKESEYFRFYPDTLNLRARWPVGDIQLKLDGN